MCRPRLRDDWSVEPSLKGITEKTTLPQDKALQRQLETVPAPHFYLSKEHSAVLDAFAGLFNALSSASLIFSLG